MERKVDETFQYEGRTYKVITSLETCAGCAFKYNAYCKAIKLITGDCSRHSRRDKTGVIFKEINNMEIKNN